MVPQQIQQPRALLIWGLFFMALGSSALPASSYSIGQDLETSAGDDDWNKKDTRKMLPCWKCGMPRYAPKDGNN